MAAPTVGPCSSWITDDDVAAECCADGATLDRSATIASNILYRLSGRQFPGICERTVRPCGSGCATWAAWPTYRSHWWHAERTASAGWGWSGVIPPIQGACAGGCRLPSVELPGPIVAVNEILVDGEALDSEVYQVSQYRRVERLDGLGFPCTQDLSLATSETGTWSVRYLYGRLPGADGIAAASVYACEIAKALCATDGAGECRLPERTKTVVRQGITFDIESDLSFLDGGRTGLGFVDAWLASVNPKGLQRRATVSRLG